MNKSISYKFRSMPGPPIAVCHNDIVLLDVLNEAGIETTTIHFHGKLLDLNFMRFYTSSRCLMISFFSIFYMFFIIGEHFRNHQYFDGTPGLTQCPILPGSL